MGILTRLRRPGTASLYEQIGGHDALEVVVEDFYCRVLDDGGLASFYAGSNMKCVKARQVEFLSSVLGGPCALHRYTDPASARRPRHHDASLRHGGRASGGFAVRGRAASGHHHRDPSGHCAAGRRGRIGGHQSGGLNTASNFAERAGSANWRPGLSRKPHARRTPFTKFGEFCENAARGLNWNA